MACPESSLLPDGGRDFHAPIVTPLELEMALGGRAWDGFYSTDFRDLASLFATAASVEDEEKDDEDGDGSGDGEEGDAPYFSLVSGGFKAPSAVAARPAGDAVAAAGGAGARGATAKSVGGGQLLAYHSPAGDFLQLREYRGLGHDRPVGGEEGGDGSGAPAAKAPAGIVEGRRGIAADYGGC